MYVCFVSNVLKGKCLGHNSEKGPFDDNALNLRSAFCLEQCFVLHSEHAQLILPFFKKANIRAIAFFGSLGRGRSMVRR